MVRFTEVARWAAATLLLAAPVLGLPQIDVAPASGSASTAPFLEITSAGTGRPDEVRLLLEASGPTAENADTAETVIATVRFHGTSARAQLPPLAEGSWRVHAVAPGFWSEPELIEPDTGSVHRITLWPAAEIELDLKLPDEREEPDEARLRLSRVPGPEEAAIPQPEGPVEITCPLGRDLRLSACPVPAGRWNLRLIVAQFAPHFLWNQGIEADKTSSLGTIELERGGSVLGLLTTEEGPVDPKRARLWLRPRIQEESIDPPQEKELQQLTRSGEILADGRFQIVGVLPGSYEIAASHPGFVIGSYAPVAVERGEWTELPEPLVLELPLRLTLAVMPAADPSGEPWSLELYSAAGPRSLEVGARGETDAAGLWESPLLPPGEYELRILDAKGNALLWQQLELRRGSEFRHVTIPIVYVEGEVTLGDRPLEATLWFGGWSGAEQVETRSSEEGTFFAVLPREGTWRVDVRSGSPSVQSRGLEVEVEPVEGLGLAEVDIRLPDTSLVGQVVDQNGLPPQTLARIHVLPLEGGAGPAGASAAPDGAFRLRGLSPMEYSVSAESDDTRSTPVTVTIAEDREASVTLVLRPDGMVSGTVISETGPVPGASVHVYPIHGTGEGARMRIEQSRTSVTGTFEAALPDGVQGARFVVMAPGYALDVSRTSDRDHVELVLDQVAGELRLEGVEHVITIRDGTVGLLMIDGEPLDLPRVLDWARQHQTAGAEGEDLAVPWMPAATYELCRLSVREAILVMDGAALPSRRACSQGYLSPGGELTLTLPS